MSKTILLLGHETSLGTQLLRWLREWMHSVHTIPRELLQDPVAVHDEIKLQKEEAGMVPDWVINCHGRNQLDRIGETALGHLGVLEENVMPLYWVVDALVAHGLGPCRVLSVASQTYRIAQTHTAVYCASKAALVQLSRTMARELAPAGWVINCLAPGKIADTRMAEITDAQVRRLRGWGEDEANQYALRNIPMRRFTNCAEVCEAMLKILALPAYINGTCIDMTGGA